MNERRHDLELGREGVGNHDREARGLCFKRYERETLAVGRQHENVHGAQQARNIASCTDKRDRFPQAESAHTRLDRGPKRTVANENEPDASIASDGRLGNVDQELVILLLPESTDVTEHERVCRETKLGPNQRGR